MIERWLKGNTFTSRKSPIAAVLVALLAVTGLVGFAQPANAVTWGPWLRFGMVIEGQTQSLDTRYDTSATVNPNVIDYGFKPDPMTSSADYSKALDI